LIDCIEPHKAFLKTLRSTGGRTYVILKFLGDAYFGDDIPMDTLARLINLEIDLSIESFTVPQREAE
jgi:hypothetical protein